MIRNYLIIAYRNLWHNKVYALINIFGLAIGLTAALFIFQYVQFERSYDSFHENADNIYRVIVHITLNGKQLPPQHFSAGAVPFAAKNECPEVVEYTRINYTREPDHIITYYPADGSDPLEFLEQKIYAADAAFMEMFSFPMIVGDPAALEEPNNLLLAESMAKKLFGENWKDAEPIGKMVMMDGEENFTVQGIFEDIPENSHIKFDGLTSIENLDKEIDTNWGRPIPAYLQVDPTSDIPALEEKLVKLTYKHIGNRYKHELNIDTFTVTLQPVRDTHLHSFGYGNDSEVRGSYATVQFLSITAFFILFLAWINYVNLSTARAVKRAKEVGIRKVVGAGRRQLITQFLLEALVINTLSLVVALTLYQICFPYFTNLIQKELPTISLVKEPWFMISIGLILILGTLMSGGYSAFVLSSFKAVSTMKGKFHTSARGILFRKSLIVFQFVISVALIIGTFSVYQQLIFMRNYEIGYDVSQKLIIQAPKITNEDFGDHYESFKNTLQGSSDVSQITASYLLTGDVRIKGHHLISSEKHPENKRVFQLTAVDEDYLKTFDIQMLHGRGFSREFPSDINAVVITEDVAIKIGFDPVASALQEKLELVWLNKEFVVIGIARDINLRSLKAESEGVIFMLRQDPQEVGIGSHSQFEYFAIEMDNTLHMEETLASIEELYKSYFPGNPFTYFFLDEHYNALYRTEEKFGKVFTAASGLAIFIACLGLFGLSAFMVRQRTKEIGIRKVLGASIQNILLLLSKDFIKLVCIAGIIALPVAYFSLHQWLKSYMYRIELSWWLFLIPVMIVIGIALCTVSFQTIKAALTNPAKVLHNE